MKEPQANSIQHAHYHLYELVKAYNNCEITIHNWEAVVKTIKNMESWFDFLPKSGVELTRDFDTYKE